MSRGLLTLAFMLVTSPAWAALAVQSTTSSTDNSASPAATNTVSLTVSSGTRLAVFACVVGSGGAGVDATGVTFNGVAFTKVGNSASRSWASVNETYASIWRLVNPDVTTANAVVTFPSNANDRTQRATYVVVTDVDQGTPSEHDAEANGTGTTLSTTVTSVTADALLMDCALGDHISGLTVGGSQTARLDDVIGVAGNGNGVSTLPLASPGAQAMTWTQTSAEWVQKAIVIKLHTTPSATLSPSYGGASMLLGIGQ